MGSLNFIKMKKIFKNILLIFVFFTLAGAMVYGADLLSSSLTSFDKIEIIGDEAYVYKLVKVTDEVKINEEDLKIDEEISKLNYLINNLEEDCSYCEYEIEFVNNTEDCYFDCFEDGSWTTESEKVHFETQIDEKLAEKEVLTRIKDELPKGVAIK